LESFGFCISNNIGGNIACATSDKHCHPFVKWAGGKTQILPQLYTLAPLKFDRYYEPFLGSGALFFHLIANKNSQFTAYLSDINRELIGSYVAIRDEAEKLINFLMQHQTAYNKAPQDYYYNLRNRYNFGDCSDKGERASLFITLNRTCFNGLYRVNMKGEFNVPWGKYVNPSICDSNNLRNISHILRNCNATIKAADYKDILLGNAKEGDFIYLDPPYSPVSTTAYFTSYTTNGFSNKDQEKLAQTYKQLAEIKCKVLLTNSNTTLVRELYSDFAKYTIEVDSKRAINCKASKREGHTDLIIRNYKL
jgi:DNA adenine methylase